MSEASNRVAEQTCEERPRQAGGSAWRLPRVVQNLARLARPTSASSRRRFVACVVARGEILLTFADIVERNERGEPSVQELAVAHSFMTTHPHADLASRRAREPDRRITMNRGVRTRDRRKLNRRVHE